MIFFYEDKISMAMKWALLRFTNINRNRNPLTESQTSTLKSGQCLIEEQQDIQHRALTQPLSNG